jgi:hypothetical protein
VQVEPGTQRSEEPVEVEVEVEVSKDTGTSEAE